MDRPSHAGVLIIVFITVLINMIGFGVIQPVMPQLLMEVTGEDLAHAARWGGVLSLVYALMQFFMSPVMGALSDRFGRRPVLLGSLAAYSADFLLAALAPTIGLLVAARLLAGAFAATIATANAYIADISPPDRRAANFGLIGASFGLGFIIGPGLGGILADAFGPRAPFFAVAAMGAVNLIFGFFFLPETLAKENRRGFEWRRANALGAFLHFRQFPVILPLAGALLLYQTAHWVLPSVWSYFAEERFAWTPTEIGFSLMAVGLAAAIVQGGLSRIIIPRLGERRAAFFGMAVAIAAYSIYGFISNPAAVYWIIPFGAFAGLTLPALQAVMSRETPANAQGELQGAIASIAGLSMMLGPIIMTQTFAAFASPESAISFAGIELFPRGAPVYFPGAPFLLAAVMTLGALLMLAGANRSAGDAERTLKREDVSATPPPAHLTTANPATVDAATATTIANREAV